MANVPKCNITVLFVFIYYRLTRRVERMEKSVGSIVTKISAVIVKLEGMEKNKAKKREAMTRILESMDQGEGGEITSSNRNVFKGTEKDTQNS